MQLISATLIIAASFQAVFSAPHGGWRKEQAGRPISSHALLPSHHQPEHHIIDAPEHQPTRHNYRRYKNPFQYAANPQPIQEGSWVPTARSWRARKEDLKSNWPLLTSNDQETVYQNSIRPFFQTAADALDRHNVQNGIDAHLENGFTADNDIFNTILSDYQTIINLVSDFTTGERDQVNELSAALQKDVDMRITFMNSGDESAGELWASED